MTKIAERMRLYPLSKHLGIPRRTLTAWFEKGAIARGNDGKFEVQEVRAYALKKERRTAPPGYITAAEACNRIGVSRQRFAKMREKYVPPEDIDPLTDPLYVGIHVYYHREYVDWIIQKRDREIAQKNLATIRKVMFERGQK